MKNKPKNQHDVPSTYLKRFANYPSDSKKSKIVTCLRIHHRKKIEEKSIDSNFFKNLNFYTIENKDPYLIENLFKVQVEPLYNKIFEEISEEKNLSEKVKCHLIIWLWFSKYRNIHQRRIIEQKLDFFTSMVSKDDPSFLGMTKKEIDQEVKIISKESHIKELFNEEIIQKFIDIFALKNWIILKSSENNKFITNDNPGFSINFKVDMPDKDSLNVSFSTIPEAVNYYPLSPDYCLMIRSFWKGIPKQFSLWNQMIKYVQLNEEHINFINLSTYSLMRKYCLANNKKYLEKYLNIDLPHQKDYSGLPIFPVGGVVIKEGEEYLTKKNRDKSSA